MCVSSSLLQAASQSLGETCTEGLEVKGWCIWTTTQCWLFVVFLGTMFNLVFNLFIHRNTSSVIHWTSTNFSQNSDLTFFYPKLWWHSINSHVHRPSSSKAARTVASDTTSWDNAMLEGAVKMIHCQGQKNDIKTALLLMAVMTIILVMTTILVCLIIIAIIHQK